MIFKNIAKISLLILLTSFLVYCKAEPKETLIIENSSIQAVNDEDIVQKYNGNFSITVETESTTSGMAIITYRFSISNAIVILDLITVHEPLNCIGAYNATENNNILEIYYKGEEEFCKMDEPNFKLKKVGQKFLMQGLGGEATYNEWIEVKKE